MEIMYISKYASLPGASAGTRGYNLCKEFLALGHGAVVINSSSNHLNRLPQPASPRGLGRFGYIELDGVPIWTHRTIRYVKTASIRRVLSWIHFELGLSSLPRHIGRSSTHIIVSSPSILTILTGLYLARKFGAYFVLEVRDIWPMGLLSERSSWFLRKITKPLEWLEKVGYKNADLIVGTMPNLVERVEEVTESHAKVCAIGLGIGDELKPLLFNQQSASRPGVFVVGYAGSFGTSNKVGVLLDVASMYDGDVSVEFRFYGKGDRYEALRATHGNQQNISFRGFLDRQQLYAELTECDLMVFATGMGPEWKYGQSLHKVVEAMALGKPILGLYSGFPSMITEAECGLLVSGGSSSEFRSALEKFRAMPEPARLRMGMKGREWLMNYRSYTSLAKHYCQELQGI